MNRRTFLSAAAGALAAQPIAQSRPNVVFILADDLGWGDLACYGNRAIRTPNIDRLASHGSLFTQFYVANPVCSPSRTAFMTGQFPARLKVHGHFDQHDNNARRGMPDWIEPSVPFLPRIFKQSGYRTGHYGKWHLGHNPGAPTPDAYGVDEHRTYVSNGPGWDLKTPGFWTHLTDWLVDESLAFIDRHRSEPFYLNIWTSLVHAILDPSDDPMKPYAKLAPSSVRDRGALQIYYAAVTELDNQVGRIMKKLDDLDLASNTIVVFSSDNGPEDIHVPNASHSAAGSAGPFRGRKRSLYEGGVRLPYIVHWPGRVPVRIDDSSVLAGVDFLPTICALAGLRPPDGALDGEDTSDILLGHPRPRRKPLYWEWRFNIAGYTVNRSPILAVRDGNWKLLFNPDGSRVELYDIPRDPSEMTNLAEKQPAVVERLRRMGTEWQKSLPPGPVDAQAGKNGWPMPRPNQHQ